jgi:serine/threonine protein kinase
MERGLLEGIREDSRAGRMPSFFTHTCIASTLAVIALGMRYVHRLGFVHGDLKPTNLMLDGDLKMQIGDFGSLELKSN